MGAIYRLATREDASRLYDIRRRSILKLAPPTMPAAEAQAWAERFTLAGMEQKLRELEVWVAEQESIVAGWGAIRGDTRWRPCMLRLNVPGRASAPDCWIGSKG
jgi:putative acetyltransferase